MKYNTIPIDELFKYFRIDDNGILYWIKSSSNRRPGEVAGQKIKDGDAYYVRIRICRVDIRGHRVAWALYYGEWPDGILDHIDGDGLNNKKDNLRIATALSNTRNSCIRKNNKSGVMGVSQDKRSLSWTARIGNNGKPMHIGSFESFFDAVCARKSAEAKLGYHPNHGKRGGCR